MRVNVENFQYLNLGVGEIVLTSQNFSMCSAVALEDWSDTSAPSHPRFSADSHPPRTAPPISKHTCDWLFSFADDPGF